MPTERGGFLQARALIATLQAELTKSQRENAQLRHQLDVLCRRLFGKLYSLIHSCRLLDVSPFLPDVLIRIASHPHHRVDDLTPRGWKATFGASLPL